MTNNLVGEMEKAIHKAIDPIADRTYAEGIGEKEYLEALQEALELYSLGVNERLDEVIGEETNE